MLPRLASKKIETLRRGFPIVAITGPRQSGKTTLAQSCFDGYEYLNLEDLDLREEAESDPRGFLDRRRAGFILDEAQRAPALFSYLQGYVDQRKEMGQVVLTGSQNFMLLESITQSLAGRVALFELLPLATSEAATKLAEGLTLDKLLFEGLYPALYDRPIDAADWHSRYLQTYVERDVRQIKNVSNLKTFQRFLKLCAGRIGQLLNANSLAADLGVDIKTIQSWLNILEASYIIFRLPPHHQNFRKRVVKQHKLYFTDTGVASSLLGIETPQQLETHFLRGGLFENYVLLEFLKRRYNEGRPSNLYFWRDHVGNEVDLLLDHAGQLTPIEIKSGATLSSSLYDSLKRFAAIASKSSAPGRLIYGGDRSSDRKEGPAHSWRQFKQPHWRESFEPAESEQ